MARKILIVEDDTDIGKALSVRLNSSGYETVVVADGYEAVCAISDEKPDLMLLDLGLPLGDGYDIMEHMKAKGIFSEVPVIVLSARDPARNQERALKAGAKAFLQKPADNNELLAAIRAALQEPDSH